MKPVKIFIAFVLVVLIAGGGLAISAALAAQVNGYAWSENIGWIKMRGATYGVDYDVNNGQFSGYAWSENVGWIKFNGKEAQVCAAVNGENCGGGANPAAGNWDGRIKLEGADFDVNYMEDSLRGCYLSGWAWGSDVVGWIKFTGNRFTTSISPCEQMPEEITPGAVSCSFTASPNRLIRPRRQATLNWSCQNAESCFLSGIGAVDAGGGSVNVYVDRTQSFTLNCSNAAYSFSAEAQIKVFKPTYCEIIPYGPGC